MLRKLYFWLFAILYLIVAFSSFYHSIEFFELSNHAWMGVILALAFEIGQAAVLFSLLTSQKERNKVLPWTLMGILTIVQILGNVYASYKYIMLNSVDNLQWFKEPIFIWTDLPDAQATVIVTYITSAILPITALLLTAMLTNQLETDKNNKVVKDILEEETKLEEETPKEFIEDKKEEYKEIAKVIVEPSTDTSIENHMLKEASDLAEQNILYNDENQITDINDKIENMQEDSEVSIEEEMIDEEKNEDVETILNGEAIPKSSYNTQSKESKFINL